MNTTTLIREFVTSSKEFGATETQRWEKVAGNKLVATMIVEMNDYVSSVADSIAISMSQVTPTMTDREVAQLLNKDMDVFDANTLEWMAQREDFDFEAISEYLEIDSYEVEFKYEVRTPRFDQEEAAELREQFDV